MTYVQWLHDLHNRDMKKYGCILQRCTREKLEGWRRYLEGGKGVMDKAATAVHESAMTVARASGGNPVLSVLVVMLFYIAFNAFEAMAERLIWGARFEHWFDLVFMLGFMAYAGLSVWCCAALRAER